MPKIIPRPLKFNFNQNFSKYWYDNCPIKTYDINVLALYIPSGERFIIHSVKEVEHLVGNEALKRNIKSFLRQEAFHSRAHSSYFKYIIQPHFPNVHANITVNPVLGIFALLFGKKFRLAMTVTGEHFTAVLSDYYLRRVEVLENVPQPIKEMWLWHCVEELEHKSLAFDVMKHLKVSYFTRVAGFLYVSLIMLYVYNKGLLSMMRQDGVLFSFAFYKSAFRYYFLSPGVFRKILRPFLAYLKPGFHPWQHDNLHLIKPYFKGKGLSFP